MAETAEAPALVAVEATVEAAAEGVTVLVAQTPNADTTAQPD